MYYPDLTIYSYSNLPDKLKARYDIPNDVVFYNVGWLDASEDYDKGYVGDAFLETFLQFVKKVTNMSRGFHVCPFCRDERLHDDHYDFICVDVEGKGITLGSREIYVFGEGCIYLCPDLIYHYMKNHSYVPPEPFRRAVEKGA